MKAYITGWNGFVGRHMYEHLTSLGWDVAGCDIRGDYAQDMREVMSFSEHWSMLKTKFDLVIHCAFHVGGREAIDGINTHGAKNLELDARFFEWAVRTGQRRVIYYSSSAAYPVDLQNVSFAAPLREEFIDLSAPELPDKAYGWAKLTAETMLVPMAREHGINVQVLRPFSGYGFDQSEAYPFAAIMRRAQHHVDGEDFHVWGPVQQARDFIHIDDVVRASLVIGMEGDNETVNLCTGVKTKFGTLSELFLDGFDKTARHITFDEDKPTGVLVRVGDPAHMLDFYEPKITIEEGVADAVKRARGDK